MSRFAESRGRIRAKLIVLIASSCALFAHIGAAAAAPSLVSSPVKVALCQSPSKIDVWMNIVGPAIARPLAARDVTEIQLKRGVNCPRLVHIETACAAAVYDASGGRGVACAPHTLELLVREAAWYALSRRPGENYEIFRKRIGGFIDEEAFHFADGHSPDQAIESRLPSLPHRDSVSIGSETGQTFLLTVNLVFSALSGHEDGHLYSAAPFCGISDRSRVEASGLYATLTRIQASGELFKAAEISPAEYHADLCATRRIREAISRYEKDLPANQQGDLKFARRAAADIVSFALLIRDPSADARPDPTPVPGYLYPPLRMAALAGELDADGKLNICGAAAQAFVSAEQADYQAYPGNGILPDDLEAILPQGVPDAWNRKAPWSAHSFDCVDDP